MVVTKLERQLLRRLGVKNLPPTSTDTLGQNTDTLGQLFGSFNLNPYPFVVYVYGSKCHIVSNRHCTGIDKHRRVTLFGIPTRKLGSFLVTLLSGGWSIIQRRRVTRQQCPNMYYKDYYNELSRAYIRLG